jgi:PKD repeat protein
MTLVVAFAAMLCGASYSADDKCAPCKKFEKCIGEPFTFDASRSTAQSCGPCPATLCYSWDFGDGCTGEGVCTTHCYEKPGEYTVKLTITDNSGLPCNTDAITQVVKVNCPPKAVFIGPDCACVGSEVTFDASRSSSQTVKTLNYKWDFGDGCTGEGQVVKHVYQQGGCYKVVLTVDDGSCSACCVDVACMDIKINTPPTAKAGDCICMKCVPSDQPFDVCFYGSGCSSTGCLTYMWNFGDGASAEGQNVSHTYKDPGVYKVTLVVDDGCNSQCSTASDSLTVTLSRQPCAKVCEGKIVCANTPVDLDCTKSVAGPNAVYAWDFGDGETATGGPRVTHTYKKCGHYKVVLTITDGECVSCDSSCVTVNEQPAAVLTGPEKACTGENIAFNACGSGDPCGDPCTYTWDFGDGATISGCDMVKACHAYEKGGVYTVKLTVDDNSGLPCAADSKSMTVTVNGRPTAIIGPCDACCVGKEILWDGSASSDPDGDKLTYSWDFGDGSTGDGPKPTHVYKAAGEYKVVLKVDDGKGSPCSVSYACYNACIHESPKADLCVN